MSSPRPRQIVFVAGLVALLVSAAGYVWIQGPLEAAIGLELQLARNVGRIMTLDEVLTMSARMAAAAHDTTYEARYNAHVDELDALLKATLALIPDDEVARAVGSTEAANLRLVEMETRSFQLDKQQQPDTALALLAGDAYRADKAVYAEGMRAAFARMEAITAQRSASVGRWALLLQIAALVALGVIAAAWLLEQREQRRRAAAHTRDLEATVAARTAELALRNRGMRLVLDNVAQGFVTVDLAGVLAPERSAIVETWFGTPAPGATLSDYLGDQAPSFAEWITLGLAELRDGHMPAELVIAQLPARFTAGAKTFDVAYNPIARGAAIDGLLVIVSDVTATLAHELVEREQRELVSLFQRITIDRSGVEEFLTEAAGLVDALRRETDPAVQRRVVHTLKGNCAIYGLQSYAELAHVVESDLGDGTGEITTEHRDALVALWKQAMARVSPLLASGRRDAIEISRAELDAALAQAAAPSALHDLLTSWIHEPMARRFERVTRQIHSLARRLDRAEPTVICVGGDLRIEQNGWQPFWAAMIHAVRNAVDHGLENPDERREAGKPEAGVIVLGAERSGGRLAFWLRDDGRGIDWDRVASRARARGLPCAGHADLVAALFADGLSTRDAIGDVSGRGIGLCALRHAVEAMGGAIDVHSVPGEGSEFRFSFDERETTAMSTATPRAMRSSLLPFLA